MPPIPPETYLGVAIEALSDLIDDESRNGDRFGVAESAVEPLRRCQELRRRIVEGEL